MTSMDETCHAQKLKDADTFAMWDFEIRILLAAKDLMDVVDGTVTLANQGQDNEKIRQFKNKDAKAKHYILMTLDNEVKVHIISCNNAKEMYDTLNNIYKRDSTQQKCTLLQEFYTYKFSMDKDIMNNITYIQNIAYKLNRLDQKIDETMVITKILSVLPDQYKHFSSAWDSTTNAEKTLENLKARLLQEETKWSGESEHLAFKTHEQVFVRELQISNTAEQRGHRSCCNLDDGRG